MTMLVRIPDSIYEVENCMTAYCNKHYQPRNNKKLSYRRETRATRYIS